MRQIRSPALVDALRREDISSILYASISIPLVIVMHMVNIVTKVILE